MATSPVPLKSMQIHHDGSPLEFSRNVRPVLEQDATVHSFVLSLVARWVDTRKTAVRLIRATDEAGNLLIAGLQTDSDRALIISRASGEVADEFANGVAREAGALVGVNGPAPTVDRFAETYARIRKVRADLETNLRLFELTQVTEPRPARGRCRPATAGDEQIIFEWLREFRDEAVPHDPRPGDEEAMKDVRTGIQLGHFFLWEDEGKCVCMVGSGRETETERWIAPVYTPPALRGRGYASSLVAAVSEKIIASGKKGTLFTNQANPTSNRIYQQIGYVPVADFRHYFFR